MEVVPKNEPVAEPQISTEPIIVKGIIPYEIEFKETKEGPLFDLKFSNSAPAQMLAMEQVMGMINKIIEAEIELLKEQRTLPKGQQKSLQRFTDTAFKKICNIMPFLEQWRNELMMEVYQRTKQEMPENQPEYQEPVAEMRGFQVWLEKTETQEAECLVHSKIDTTMDPAMWYGYTFREACKVAMVDMGFDFENYNEQRNTYLNRRFCASANEANHVVEQL